MAPQSTNDHAPRADACEGSGECPRSESRVCAVVVTFNRKSLLAECLEAVERQTHAVERIAVVDNASTDGTDEYLRSRGGVTGSKIEALRLPTNLGGAGGFRTGIEWAFAGHYDWIWLMDDDTIPDPSALAALLRARATLAPRISVDLLTSRVLWTDGSVHRMNVPWPQSGSTAAGEAMAQLGLTPIRAATFVSTLIHRRVVERVGLPLADYFIWSDDIEYTGRFLKQHAGVLVPDSVVIHKTAHTYTALDAPPERFYYHVRNTIWMVTRSTAWTLRERRTQAAALPVWIAAFLKRSKNRSSALRYIAAAIRDGLVRGPKR